MMVARVRDHYHLKSRYDRLRERGLLTLAEVALRALAGRSVIASTPLTRT